MREVQSALSVVQSGIQVLAIGNASHSKFLVEGINFPDCFLAYLVASIFQLNQVRKVGRVCWRRRSGRFVRRRSSCFQGHIRLRILERELDNLFFNGLIVMQKQQVGRIACDLSFGGCMAVPVQEVSNDLCVRRELRRALARVSRSSAGLAVKNAQQAATLALDLTFFIVALPPTRLCPSRRHHMASRTDLKN